MKKILITGKGSYVGGNVEHWLKRLGYTVDVLDMLDRKWQDYDFASFDVIYHVAGIAHADIMGISDEEKQRYYDVNCNLAVKVAEKAKSSGATQFIYMSSLLVYGDSGTGSYKEKRYIDGDTTPNPSNFYGDSKWQAELKLKELDNEHFHVAILRPPMIYGKGCKGNYNQLRRIAKMVPFFPDYDNKRSVLYIENLCEFVRLLIEDGGGGVFFPQNREQIKTSDFISQIGVCHGKRIKVSRHLNFLIFVGAHIPGKIGNMINKAFGSLVVEPTLSNDFSGRYQVVSFEESILRSEK